MSRLVGVDGAVNVRLAPLPASVTETPLTCEYAYVNGAVPPVTLLLIEMFVPTVAGDGETTKLTDDGPGSTITIPPPTKADLPTRCHSLRRSVEFHRQT